MYRVWGQIAQEPILSAADKFTNKQTYKHSTLYSVSQQKRANFGKL